MEKGTDGFQEDAGKEVNQAYYKVLVWQGSFLPEAYTAMIFSKWLRSLRYGNDYFKLIDSESYYNTYNQYIQAILNKPGTIVRIAVLADDEDVALGWSVSEGDTLHYVHCQKDSRNKGIATTLVPFQVNNITHLTKTGMAIWNKKLPNAKFNPFK